MIKIDDYDLDLIKKYLLLPIVVRTIEYDQSQMINSELKMTKVYMEVLNPVLDQIEIELRKIRREMKERGIRVFNEEISKEGIRSKYLCRGYQSEFNILSFIVKAQVEVLLRKYLRVN